MPITMVKEAYGNSKQGLTGRLMSLGQVSLAIEVGLFCHGNNKQGLTGRLMINVFALLRLSLGQVSLAIEVGLFCHRNRSFLL